MEISVLQMNETSDKLKQKREQHDRDEGMKETKKAWREREWEQTFWIYKSARKTLRFTFIMRSISLYQYMYVRSVCIWTCVSCVCYNLHSNIRTVGDFALALASPFEMSQFSLVLQHNVCAYTSLNVVVIKYYSVCTLYTERRYVCACICVYLECLLSSCRATREQKTRENEWDEVRKMGTQNISVITYLLQLKVHRSCAYVGPRIYTYVRNVCVCVCAPVCMDEHVSMYGMHFCPIV